jgi:hypothetical protein
MGLECGNLPYNPVKPEQKSLTSRFYAFISKSKYA